MTPERYVSSLRSDAAAFADAARLGFEADVAACPGWNVGALTDHLGHVHRFWMGALTAAGAQPAEVTTPGADGVEVAWFEEGSAALADALATATPDQPVWNWTGVEQNAGWLMRRMAQETAVHRWDAQAAHGRAEPVAADVAVDGIAELFDTFVPAAVAYGYEARGGEATISMRADEGTPWTVRFGGGTLSAQPAVGDDEPEPDLMVSGSGSDLLLLLWNRRSLDGLGVKGDAQVLEQWRNLPMF